MSLQWIAASIVLVTTAAAAVAQGSGPGGATRVQQAAGNIVLSSETCKPICDKGTTDVSLSDVEKSMLLKCFGAGMCPPPGKGSYSAGIPPRERDNSVARQPPLDGIFSPAGRLFDLLRQPRV